MKTTDCFKLGKEYNKNVYCHPTYLTYMQSISCEMLGWMKHKWESRLPEEISITSDVQMPPPYGIPGILMNAWLDISTKQVKFSAFLELSFS